MNGIFTLFVLGIGLVAGQHGHGGGHVPSTGEVNQAIVDIELHYNDKLCLELLLVDCTKHVTVGDEQVCASNGVTYDNHCRFTHAMCEYLHSTNGMSLSLASHGPCPVTTLPPLTTAAATNAPVATNAPAGTGAPVATNAPTTTTTAATTSTVAPTTTNAINNIVQNVFCQNAGTISCASSFQIICGTDGQLYPNECELSKAKCNDPTLTIDKDTSNCALP